MRNVRFYASEVEKSIELQCPNICAIVYVNYIKMLCEYSDLINYCLSQKVLIVASGYSSLFPSGHVT